MTGGQTPSITPPEPDCQPILTAGIVADTHVPDRVYEIHPGILPFFQSQGVTQILHCGDICSASVLEELSQYAPVTAVRGNRDLTLLAPATVHPDRLCRGTGGIDAWSRRSA